MEARELQAAGKPVVTVYPGAIYGPDDPYVGSQTERFFWVVKRPVPDVVEGRACWPPTSATRPRSSPR